MLCEACQNSSLKLTTALQRRHERRHSSRALHQGPMLPLIFPNVAGSDCAGKRERLPESQAHALTGDCIH